LKPPALAAAVRTAAVRASERATERASAGRAAASRARAAVGAGVRWAVPRARVLAAHAVDWRGARELWRRSLQLRVVATTLLLSSAVVLALGQLLVSRISTGLVDSRVDQTLAEVTAGQEYAQRQLQALGGPEDPALQDTLQSTVTTLSARGGRAGQNNVIVLPDPATSTRIRSVVTASVREDGVTIPSDLVSTVVEEDQLAYQFTSQSTRGGSREPYVVAGAPLKTTAGSFGLYYLVPLEDEADAVALVQRALLATGVLLVLLLAAVAAIVTRQVVRPVRLAARTAERLSTGLLEERMAVRGTDDLARLAESFNQMAASLQRQIAQLEDLSRLQRRFTSDVSHELRTPLATVRMAADLLYAAREEFEPSVGRSAELLQEELERFESLLADLLEISRLDAGMAALEPDTVDMRRLVERAVAAIGSLADQAGVPLEVNLPEHAVLCEADARRVERILRNLLGNAIEHGESRPVVVTLAGDDDAVAVTVRDHGVGLRPGEAQLVFNRFWRADPSRARRTGGTGLGLSISLEDARLHGGWLQAWGQRGRGAQFRLTLPGTVGGRLTSSPLRLAPADARRGAAVPARLPPAAAAPPSGSRLRRPLARVRVPPRSDGAVDPALAADLDGRVRADLEAGRSPGSSPGSASEDSGDSSRDDSPDVPGWRAGRRHG
jgi:two-component system sensor histidine kinase MtrB